MKKVLIIGAAMLDLVMQVEQLPKKGGDAYASAQEMTVGGCAYNVADIVKRFGVPYTLFAPVGFGFYASFIEQELKKKGHESVLRTQAGDNGYCLCMVEPDGERTFLTLPGVECRFQTEWFSQINPAEYDSVYVSGYEMEGEGGKAILAFLEEHPELTLYYAPGPRITFISKEVQERMLRLRPVLHLNEKEALEYTESLTYGEAAEKLFEKSRNTVLITLGSRGCFLYEDGNVCLVPAKQAEVVDTIGAGDSNLGAIIAVRKLEGTMEEAVRAGNQVSALVVQTKGPTLSGITFDKGEWERWIG